MTEGSTVTTTKYLDGYQYENNVLKFFPHAEGYVTKEGSSTYRHVFTYTDHLGNIRLKYCDLNQNGSIETNEILEENHYYPFGLKHEGYNGDVLALANKYKYNGKEWQDELGINFYDYGARNYDPAIGRWMNIDPLAENSRRWTPYNYAYNNPVYFVDPDGMQSTKWLNGDGKLVYDAEKNEYTKHATEQDKKFGEALKNSGHEGQKQFDALTKSETNVKVSFKDELSSNYPRQEGFTDNIKTDSEGNVVSAEINIYMKSVNENVEGINSGEINKKDYDLTSIQEQIVDVVKNNNISVFEKAVATFGHEIGHTLKRNVFRRFAASKGAAQTFEQSDEFEPQSSELQILKDISNKKK